MSSNHLILCRLILLPSIRVFSNVPVRCSHHLLRSDGQSIGASASASVLPMSIQCWFPLGLTGMIFLLFKGLSRVFSSTIVQFSCSVMSDSLWPHDPQHARPPCPSPTPGVHLNPCPLMPSNHLIFCCFLLFTSLLPYFTSPALNLSQHQGIFQWVSSLHQVAKVLEFELHHQSFQWIFRTDFL